MQPQHIEKQTVNSQIYIPKFSQLVEAFHKNFKNLWQKPQIQKVQKKIQKQLDEEQKHILEFLDVVLNVDNLKFQKPKQITMSARKLYTIDENYQQVIPIIYLIYARKQLIIQKKIFKQIQKHLSVFIWDLMPTQLVPKKQNITVQVPQPKEGVQYPKWFTGTQNYKNIEELKKRNDEVFLKISQQYQKFQQFVHNVFPKGKHIKTNLKLGYDRDQNRQFRDFFRVLEKIVILSPDLKEKFLEQIQKNISDRKQDNISLFLFGKLVTDLGLQYIQKQMDQMCERNQIIGIVVNDFLRGHVFFEDQKSLIQGISQLKQQIDKRGYSIVQQYQRVMRGTKEISIKILIQQSICQIQLIKYPFDSTQVDMVNREYIHCLYQILRSPYGSLIGCVTIMSKFRQCKFLQKLSKLSQIKLNENDEKNVTQFLKLCF